MYHNQEIIDAVAVNGDRKSTSPPSAQTGSLCRTYSSWLDIVAGITLAGGLYFVAVAVLFALYGVAAGIWGLASGPPSHEQFERIFGSLGIAILITGFGGATGTVLTFWTAAVTAPVVGSFVKSLQLQVSLSSIGAVWGGTIGFLAVMPMTVAIVDQVNKSGGTLNVFGVVILGPGLATIAGQLGGAWGAKRALQNNERELPKQWPIEANSESKHLRFGIRHLLWITLWSSLLLALIRLSGAAFQYVLPPLAGWLAYQTATLFLGRRIARRIGPWWTRRRARRNSPMLWPR